MRPMQAKTLVIIPTYDERENVGPISTAVHKHAPEAHILFVDDKTSNVDGARMAGWRAVLYRGPESLERALAGWG